MDYYLPRLFCYLGHFKKGNQQTAWLVLAQQVLFCINDR
jgi:hypothetical protein